MVTETTQFGQFNFILLFNVDSFFFGPGVVCVALRMVYPTVRHTLTAHTVHTDAHILLT